MIAIGIDIGGTSIKGAGITKEGKVLEVFSMPVDKADTQEATINKLIDAVNKYIKDQGFKKEEILGIGCGVPGVMDTKTGIVTYSNNLRWFDLPIVEMLEKGTGLKVRITNDANAAALGEARFGAGKKYKNIIMITLGTGVGGGIVIDGKLFEGNLGKGAELGHSVLVMDGEQCSCGRKGCFEAYASATALIRDTKRAMEQHKESKCWEVAEKLGKVDARVAFEADRLGDETGHQLVENYVKYLGEGLLNYFNIFRPEALILSGGIANEGKYLLSRLRKYFKLYNYGFQGTPKVDLLVSELGYDSGKIGAAALFF